jgi:hypothetical protein
MVLRGPLLTDSEMTGVSRKVRANLQQAIGKMQSDNFDIISPFAMLAALLECRPHMAGGGQQDACEFLVACMELAYKSTHALLTHALLDSSNTASMVFCRCHAVPREWCFDGFTPYCANGALMVSRNTTSMGLFVPSFATSMMPCWFQAVLRQWCFEMVSINSASMVRRWCQAVLRQCCFGGVKQYAALNGALMVSNSIAPMMNCWCQTLRQQ